MDKLRTALGATLNIEALLAVEAHVIPDVISSVGSWRRKTHIVPHTTLSSSAEFRTTEKVESSYIRQPAQRLRGGSDSDVLKTVDELCSLPGVGSKMAFFLAYMTLVVCTFSHVLNPPDLAHIDDDLGQECEHWLGRSCIPYHQRAKLTPWT